MAVFTVTTNADSGVGSLREAIGFTNANADADTIVFASGLAGMGITLASQLLIIADVTIDGDTDGNDKADITISGDDVTRIFEISGSTTDVTLASLTLEEGKVTFGVGGAIYAKGNSLTVIHSTLQNNNVSGAGGAIYVSGSGDLALFNSTVSGNTANGFAGGINTSGGFAHIVNSTVVGNSAANGAGGIDLGGDARIENSTISGNHTIQEAANGGGGADLYQYKTVEIINSVIAGNTAGVASDASDFTFSTGVFAALRGSFIGSSDAAIYFIDEVDSTRNGGDAMLGALADNYGTVETMAILRGSPLIGAGLAGDLLAIDEFDIDGDTVTAEQLPIDANGLSRLSDGSLDIGAVQSTFLVVDTLLDGDDSNYTAGNLSLREAISLVAEGGKIFFDASLAGGTITLTDGELMLNKSVIIDGDTNGNDKADITISGNGASRAFNISGVSTDVTLASLTLEDGHTDGFGGAIYADAYNLTVLHSTLQNNTADFTGGAVYIAGSGYFGLANSTVNDNTSFNSAGGGIHTVSGITTAITNSTIVNNTAAQDGGGLDLYGDVRIYHSTVSGNHTIQEMTGGGGGGVRFSLIKTVTISSTVISGNTAGVAKDASDFAHDSGTFSILSGSYIGSLNASIMFGFNSGSTVNGGHANTGLGVLADNGGTVLTMALLNGSALIGGGANGDVPEDEFDVDSNNDIDENLPLDARGLARVFGSDVDIGAVEKITNEANSIIRGDDDANTLNGDAANNTLFGYGEKDKLYAHEGDDKLYAGAGDDKLYGDDGDDRLYGGDDDDRLDGGDDDDKLYGEDGKDKLYGRDGNDRLDGGDGNDDLKGHDGKDKLYGRDGKDKLDGGAGNDDLKGHDGADKLYGRDGKDKLDGGDGNDKLYGHDAADKLYGKDGNDKLDGGDGNDKLYGGDGADKLYGRDGNDKLYAGKGNDKYYGGDGKDTFHFDRGDDKDTIKDFEDNRDTIELDRFNFTDVADALSNAVQDGNDVVFNFGSGDRLTVEDVTLAQLSNDIDLV